jgi:hypothetical protein
MNWITQEKKKPESQARSELILMYEQTINNCFLDTDGANEEFKKKKSKFKKK